ncbi:unnamed protein product [Cladocopium goreaui]|uniref:Uncharacterized protein n=1 Tax=Cladocopium goreaui TaxID=2562237 RepID=A0A9P1G6H4_9DINO|nr:unnamed protein product [Cladocopium goreaui]
MIREYIVDNSHLQASTPGLGYRRTKSSSARVENAWEPWGKVVKGVDEGDWLRVGQLFLPKSLGGFAVLHSKGSKKRVAKNGAAPQYVDCLMTWPTCSDFAALEAESSHCSASSSVRSTGEASAHEAPRKIPISEVCSAVAMAAACPSHGRGCSVGSMALAIFGSDRQRALANVEGMGIRFQGKPPNDPGTSVIS